MSRCTTLRAAAPCCQCSRQLPLQPPGCTTLRASVRFACPEARRPTLGRADLLRQPRAPGRRRRVSVTWRRRCCHGSDIWQQSCKVGLFLENNKAGRGVVAHTRRCAQTDSSAIKLAPHVSLFSRMCVLGLCQDPAPHPKMVERRVVGGGIQDSRSMQPRIRKARLLITHVLDSCVKFLAVLHISSAQGRSADRTSAGSS